MHTQFLRLALLSFLLVALLGGCATGSAGGVSYKSRMIETLLAEEWDCREAVRSIASNLSHKSWYVRKEAAELLGEIDEGGCRADAARDSLLAALRDRDENVRVAAAWSLGTIFAGSRSEGIQSVVKALVSGLKDEFWIVRVASADALGGIGAEANSAIKALVDAGSDDNWWVRMYSLLARRHIEDSITQK